MRYGTTAIAAVRQARENAAPATRAAGHGIAPRNPAELTPIDPRRAYSPSSRMLPNAAAPWAAVACAFPATTTSRTRYARALVMDLSPWD